MSYLFLGNQKRLQTQSYSSINTTSISHCNNISMGRKKNTTIVEPKQAQLPVTLEYDAERVVDKRTKGNAVQYLIKWSGYSSSENTWEPLKHLENISDLIQQYEDKAKRTKKIKKIQTKITSKSSSKDIKLSKQQQKKNIIKSIKSNNKKEVLLNKKDLQKQKTPLVSEEASILQKSFSIRKKLVLESSHHILSKSESVVIISNSFKNNSESRGISNVAQPNDTAQKIIFEGRQESVSQSANQNQRVQNILQQNKQLEVEILIQSPIKNSNYLIESDEKQKEIIMTTHKQKYDQMEVQQEPNQINLIQIMMAEQQIKDHENNRVNQIEIESQNQCFEQVENNNPNKDQEIKENQCENKDLVDISHEKIQTSYCNIEPVSNFLFNSKNQALFLNKQISYQNSINEKIVLPSKIQSFTQTNPTFEVKILQDQDSSSSQLLFQQPPNRQISSIYPGYYVPAGQLNIEEYLKECEQKLEGGTILGVENLLINVQIQDKNKKTSSNHLVRLDKMREHSEEVMVYLLKSLLKFK